MMAKKPYQQVPFQYSVHKVTSEGITHNEFLHDDMNDPCLPFLASLKQHIGEKGSIVVFNQSFEKNTITRMCSCFP